MDGTTFMFCGGTRTPLGGGRVLFRSPLSGRVSIVANDVAVLASMCRELATLDEHSARVQQIMVGRRLARAPRDLLDEAVAQELLAPLSTVASRLIGSVARTVSPAPISDISVPTKDRPAVLSRALASIRDQVVHFGRQAAIHIVDDSSSPANRTANRQAIRSTLGREIQYRYVDRDDRAAAAAALARDSGVPQDVVSFAVLGDPEMPVSVGACRNWLLLATCGRRTLFVDDDVVLRTVVIPGSDDELTFERERQSYEFLCDERDVGRYECRVEDLLALHQRTLALDAAAIERAASARDGALLRGVSADLLERLGHGDGRVVVSQTGLIGDVALDDPLPYFLFGLPALTSSEDTYRAALTTRLVLRGPHGVYVTHESACMSFCMAVDNTTLLPPCLPVQRAEEAVFGTLTARCVPAALFATVPRAVLHRPAERRQFTTLGSERAGRMNTGEAVSTLVRNESVHGRMTADRLTSLGRRLEEAASRPAVEFAAYLREMLRPAMVRRLELLDRAVQHASGTPFWLDDVIRLRDGCLASLASSEYVVPLDLQSIWNADEARHRFQRVIGRFGRLLAAWPHLVSSAGRHPC